MIWKETAWAEIPLKQQSHFRNSDGLAQKLGNYSLPVAWLLIDCNQSLAKLNWLQPKFQPNEKHA